MNPMFYMPVDTLSKDMMEYLETYNRPAIIIDRNWKAIYRNELVVYKDCHIRLGMNAKTFLPQSEITVMKRMAYGAIQEVRTYTLTKHERLALVSRFNSYYVLVLKPKGFSPLVDEVLKASAFIGYSTESILGFCNGLNPGNRNDMLGLKHLAGEQLLRHSKVCKMLDLTAMPILCPYTFFNPGVALEFTCKKVIPLLEENDISVKSKFDTSIYMGYTNEYDYHTAIASLLMVAARCTNGKVLEVESIDSRTLFTVKVTFDSDIDPKSLTGSLANRKAYDWEKFMNADILHLQCLAEGYNWYFNISSPSENRLCFTLIMPLTREQTMVLMTPRKRQMLTGIITSQFISLKKYKK